ncbi:hypothetical protein EON65_38970 [archaeon]|nr:MAG: hypothetical protein EON65_38970 [archaeon]
MSSRPSATSYAGHQPSLSDQDSHLLRIVERVSLDRIVQDKKQRMDKISGVPLRASDLRKQVMERADIVACTLSGAGSQPILEVVLRISGFTFDCVVIDEAAQAVEPSSLIPFKYNPQLVVMVGDPCQLPATVFSRLCKEANYSQSLFQRLQRSGVPVAMLETQYRMHPAIAEFPSMRYYNNFLVTDPHVAATVPNSKGYYQDKSELFRPIVFHDVMYGREKLEGFSMYNTAEARYVVDLFCTLIRDYPKEKTNIGIIAPYRAQRKLITRMLKEHLGGKVYNALDTEISTVDGFQGREKDIIIFSCVRAPTGNSSKQLIDRSGAGIGFLKEWQRLNVAITRARFGLWLVGHKATLQKDGEWDALIRFIEAKKAVVHLTNDKAFRECLRRRDGANVGKDVSECVGGGKSGNHLRAGDGQRPKAKEEPWQAKRKMKLERGQARKEEEKKERGVVEEKKGDDGAALNGIPGGK